MPTATPVALLAFNRPDLAERVFGEIRHARPTHLFFIADGPRFAADNDKCRATQAVIERVDWPCKVETNIAPTNMGCGRRISSGLDWLFSRTEEAIILEDDCLPSPSFFPYCEELLARYRNNENVMHVAGSNFDPEQARSADSYSFSKYALIWGWATWRRAWQHYRFSIPDWPEFKKERLRQIFPDRVERAHWERRLAPIYNGERTDTWDYQWIYTVFSRQGLAGVPSVNLISNIGIREDATHTSKSSQLGNLPVGEIKQIRHPPTVAADERMDRLIFDIFFGGVRMRERSTLTYRLAKPMRLWRNWFGAS